MVELGIQDVRNNLWLIDDILSSFVTNPYLNQKYGQKQIDACKEWLKNNQIDVYMRDRNDKDRMPCITISLGNQHEKEEMKLMGDESTEKVTLMPNTIGKPIAYIVKPFVPAGYNIETGEVDIPAATPNLNFVSPGMILVNPTNGQGYVIQAIGPNGVIIDAGIELNASLLAVVPKFPFYIARREHTFFQETYSIGCHVHGDPQTLLWLHSIVVYTLGRYRESLLEAQGFAESKFSSSDLLENPAYTDAGGEMAWTRIITLTGQTEASWIKAPHRVIETTLLGQRIKDCCETEFISGISIIANTDPSIIDKTDVNWYTDTAAEADAPVDTDGYESEDDEE